MHDLPYVGFAADVARVDAEPVDAGFKCGEREFVVEMDIGDDRDTCLLGDCRERIGSFSVGDGEADDIAADLCDGGDLRDGCVDIARVGLGHCLDADRCITADGDWADIDLSGLSSGCEKGVSH